MHTALTLKDRLFQCGGCGCGHVEDRDLHAARGESRRLWTSEPLGPAGQFD